MKLCIDGEKWVEVKNDITVVLDDVFENHEELHLRISDEGVVFDHLFEDGDVCGTGWQTPEDLVESICH